MKKLLVVLVLLSLCSCITWQPACRHDAVYSAIVVGEEYPVRFIYGTYLAQKHIRAQAKIDGRWQYIEPFGAGLIKIGKPEPLFFEEKILSFQEYIQIIKNRIKEPDSFF